MSFVSTRPGYREPSSLNIPTQRILNGDSDVPGECRILKLERDTVIWREERRDEAAPVVFKMYRNRGCVSWQRERLFHFRVEREYLALDFLVRNRIRCSFPLFWTYGSAPDHGRYEILCMREIPGAIPFDEMVLSGRADEIDCVALSKMIQQMHRAGFFHGSLAPRNLLVGSGDDGVSRLHIIDTPRALVFPGDITGTKMAWLDLKQILFLMKRHMGVEACRSLLNGYGLDEKATGQMFRRMDQSPPPRLTRKLNKNLLRFSLGLRSKFAFLSSRVKCRYVGPYHRSESWPTR